MLKSRKLRYLESRGPWAVGVATKGPRGSLNRVVSETTHLTGLKAGSQYDAGPRVAMRQHAMRSPASRRSNRTVFYSRVTVRCVAIHCSRDVHNCVSRRNIAQRIAMRGPASYCEPAFRLLRAHTHAIGRGILNGWQRITTDACERASQASQ